MKQTGKYDAKKGEYGVAVRDKNQKLSEHSSGDQDEWSDPMQSDSGTGFFTAPQFISSKEAEQPPEQQKSQQQAGVQMPALLQSLFGLDFLPMLTPISNKIEEEVFVDSTEGDSYEHRFEEQEHELDLDIGLVHLSHDQTAPDEDDEENSVDEEAASRRNFRGQRIKKAFGTLKNRVQEAKGRRRTQSNDNDSTFDNSNTMRNTPDQKGRSLPNNTVKDPWLQTQRVTLQQHKTNLSKIQKQATDVQAQVEEMCNRLRSSQEEIMEIERLLTKSVNRLQEETVVLAEAKNSLTTLEQQRDYAERALNDTALSIRNGIGVGVVVIPVSAEFPHISTAARQKDAPRTPKARHFSGSLGRSQTAPPPDRNRDDNSLRARGSTIDFHSASSRLCFFDGDESASENLTSRARSASVPDIQKELRRVQSSFIRVHDLDITSRSESSGSQAGLVQDSVDSSNRAKDPFFSIDQDVGSVLDALIRFGYDVLADESQRFRPLQNTERILAKKAGLDPPESWPIHPWNSVSGDDVLVWQGSSNHHGPGRDLPVIKARGIVPTTPELVMDLLLDSSRVGEYNKMSQGRSDLLYLQQGLNTKASDSEYGIAGEAKIIKALNRPPVIRRNIEMMTLIYARALQESQPCNSYISVSRSVWEDETGVAKTAKDTFRSEMLLGVTLVRPVEASDGQCHCELTTITHIQTSVVPEVLSRRAAPSHAVGFIKEIQQVFANKC